MSQKGKQELITNFFTIPHLRSSVSLHRQITVILSCRYVVALVTTDHNKSSVKFEKGKNDPPEVLLEYMAMFHASIQCELLKPYQNFISLQRNQP